MSELTETDARVQRLHEALHYEHPEDYDYTAWCVGDCHEDGTHDPEDCPPEGCPRCVTCPLCPDWSSIDPDEWEANPPAANAAARTRLRALQARVAALEWIAGRRPEPPVRTVRTMEAAARAALAQPAPAEEVGR